VKKFLVISFSCALIAFCIGLSWAHLGSKVGRVFSHGKTLKILCDETWLPQALLEEYAARSGLSFQYYTYNRPSEFVRQIANAGASFDVICFHSSVAKSLIQAGVLKKINPRDLSNFEQVSVDFHNLPFDPDFEYSIPFAWNVLGFLTKAVPKELPWRERWTQSAKRIQLWPVELDIFFTLLQSGWEGSEWTDETQTRKFSEYLKRFSGAAHGFVNPEQIQAALVNLGGDVDMVQVPSGHAADILKDRKDLQYWIPKDGVSVAVQLIGQGATSENQKEGFALIDWLIDGAQALRIQKFSRASVVQTALNSSDQLEALQKASLLREIPSGELKFTNIEMDAIPRFEKLFREASVESKRH
jgi:spermidine/putrescine transport system substrate-binding protein